MVGTAEVVIDATEAEMTGEGGDVIGDGPGTTGERGDELTEGEVEAFDEGGFDLAGEAEGEESSAIGGALATAHESVEELEFVTGFDLDELSEEEGGVNGPSGETFAGRRGRPEAEVGGEGIEVKAEAIAAERRNAAGSEAGFEIVDEGVSQELGARADLEGEDDLRAGFEGDPDPDILSMADMGFEFVKLDVVGDPMVTVMIMKGLIELAEADEPASDGGGMVLEDADGGGLIDAFAEGSDDFIDAAKRGFQVVHGSEAALTEALAASLTAEPLDRVMYAAQTIADEGVEVVIADAKVITARIGAVLASSRDGFRATAGAFAL